VEVIVRVSCILPCRNEEAFIGPCLDSFLATAYPPEQLELLVVDGSSNDRTREIVERYSAKHPWIRLLDNPKRIVPTALNIGIKAATGDVIVRLDAHVVYPPDYIPRCGAALASSGAENVGGMVVTLPASDTRVAEAVAVGVSHP